jgi:antitoxin component YwqK of YwqJK toxin-antitoxin module
MYASATGEKDWQYERGIRELTLLREIYNHNVTVEKVPNGIKKTYYPNETIEIEQSFENGLPNGQKTVYYPNGRIMINENYENGQREGNSIWYDRKGRVERNLKFSNGHPVDTCYYYWFFNGQVQHERIFDDAGNMIKNSSFNHDGVLKEVAIVDSKTNQYIKTSYYESGAIRYVAISNSENYQSIRTTEYYESGSKEKEWEYYPDDSTKVFKYWEWSADGKLSSSYILKKDRTKIDLINKADNKH